MIEIVDSDGCILGLLDQRVHELARPGMDCIFACLSRDRRLQGPLTWRQCLSCAGIASTLSVEA